MAAVHAENRGKRIAAAHGSTAADEGTTKVVARNELCSGLAFVAANFSVLHAPSHSSSSIRSRATKSTQACTHS